MAYTAFLAELAKLSALLDQVQERLLSPEPPGIPLPYLTGKVCVHLDGTHVGSFDLCEDWANYEDEEMTACPSLA